MTAVFNAVSTIDQTLRSVESQVDANFEHIVVDGASSDGTLAILLARRKSISVLVSEPDRGIYDALNKGIALATGDELLTRTYAKAVPFILVLDNENIHFRKSFEDVLGKRAATKLLRRAQFHHSTTPPSMRAG